MGTANLWLLNHIYEKRETTLLMLFRDKVGLSIPGDGGWATGGMGSFLKNRMGRSRTCWNLRKPVIWSLASAAEENTATLFAMVENAVSMALW